MHKLYVLVLGVYINIPPKATSLSHLTDCHAMKRIVLLFGILLFMSFWAKAQSRFSGGILLAPFSSYAGEPRDYEAPSRYSIGISLGLQAQYDFTERWSLASGLWYETASVKMGNGVFGNAYRIPQHNITIPLLLNFRPTERKVSPYFSGGTLLVSRQEERGLTAKALLSAGLSYQINPLFTLNVQPALTLGANSKSDRVVYPSNRQLSLQAQILYHFLSRKAE